MPFYKKFFYCLDSECGEFKSACQDCKYWNKSEGYYLETFLGASCICVVQESGYAIFVHSDRLIKYVRVACGKTENLLFNIDYEDRESVFDFGDGEILVMNNEVCVFGPDTRLVDEDEINCIKELIKKYRSLIEEKFIEVDKMANE